MFPLAVEELGSCYLGIDVGSEKSGLALYHKITKEITGGIFHNSEILKEHPLDVGRFNTVIIEYPDSIQPKVGHEFVKMVYEAGRFHQHFCKRNVVHQMGRSFVKKKIGKNDSEVRKFLLDKYGKDACRDLKKDSWQAFALIHCWLNE